MKFTRKTSILLNSVINDYIPPVLRDAKWFMYPFFKILFKDKANLFINFRKKAPYLTDKQFESLYRETADCNLLKETDLNEECLEIIPTRITGKSVLDIGCGRGVLAKKLAQNYHVKACDIIVPSQDRTHNIEWHKANIEELPFSNDIVDTAVCTHVLEHVRDIDKAIRELRRVARRRLIVVVPRERPYKCAFNLHLTFFPYEFSVATVLGKGVSSENYSIENIAGDWLYIEELDKC
jgi:SAM-dependent methyltransferase